MEVYQIRQTANVDNCLLNYEFVLNPRVDALGYRAKMSCIDSEFKGQLAFISRKHSSFFISKFQIQYIGKL